MSDYKKPDEVDQETWQKHLDWMRVMESSRQPARPFRDLLDNYFIPPGSGKTGGRNDREN